MYRIKTFMHIKFTKGISLSLIENLSSARKVWHICTVYCTWSNFILSRWYFMIKQKGFLILFFQICMNWETKLKPKILDLNHCRGKIHLEVSVGNRIYKNRECLMNHPSHLHGSKTHLPGGFGVLCLRFPFDWLPL